MYLLISLKLLEDKRFYMTDFYCSYQTQHQAFVAHTLQQIQQLEMQKRAIELQNTHDQNNDSMQQQNNYQNNSYNDQNFQQMGGYEQKYNNSNNQHYGSECGDNYQSNNSLSGNENSFDSQAFDHITNNKKNHDNHEEPDLSHHLPNVNFSQPPPGYQVPEDPALLAFQNGLPDLTKPPPGYPAYVPEPCNEDLMPSVPYFELPAGLMVPLIMVNMFFEMY